MKNNKKEKSKFMILIYTIFIGFVMVSIIIAMNNLLGYGNLYSKYMDLQSKYVKLEKEYNEANTEIDTLNERIERLQSR